MASTPTDWSSLILCTPREMRQVSREGGPGADVLVRFRAAETGEKLVRGAAALDGRAVRAAAPAFRQLEKAEPVEMEVRAAPAPPRSPDVTAEAARRAQVAVSVDGGRSWTAPAPERFRVHPAVALDWVRPSEVLRAGGQELLVGGAGVVDSRDVAVRPPMTLQSALPSGRPVWRCKAASRTTPSPPPSPDCSPYRVSYGSLTPSRPQQVRLVPAGDNLLEARAPPPDVPGRFLAMRRAVGATTPLLPAPGEYQVHVSFNCTPPPSLLLPLPVSLLYTHSLPL